MNQIIVYYSNKSSRGISLDHDVTSGRGPETTKFKMKPGVKYIYAVHRYSNDGELTQSGAVVRFGGNNHSIPVFNRPSATHWIVCVMNGSTKEIKVVNEFVDNQGADFIPPNSYYDLV